MYRVTEADSDSYQTGPEMQVLDDAGQHDGLSRLTAAGSVHGLYPAPEGLVRPVGSGNEVRIVVKGNDVEHRLNGTLVAGPGQPRLECAGGEGASSPSGTGSGKPRRDTSRCRITAPGGVSGI